jgi:phosphoglycerol transferase MdoB-like AlkP superfamily enzyme
LPQDKGFFGSLFDTTFSSLITTKIIRVLYILALIVIGLAALFYTIFAFTQSAALGVITLLVLAPLAALLYAIYTRVILEVIIVLFRILETNQQIAANTAGLAGGGAPSSTFVPPATSGGYDAPPPPPPPPGL